MKLKYILILFILTACTQGVKKESSASKPELKIKSYQNSQTQGMLSTGELLKLTKKNAINKYGEPATIEQFILDDAQGEFRIGLHTIYTEKERQTESILIDELTWQKDKNTWVTAWYEVDKVNSLAKDAYEWAKGTEF